MFPLSDPDIPRQTRPILTIGLIITNVLVFAYQFFLNDIDTFILTYKFGAIPAEILGNRYLETFPVRLGLRIYHLDIATPIPSLATIFTSMFMHGGFMHLVGNMLFLWVFGNSLEDRMNRLFFLIFYFVSGTVAVLAHTMIDPSSLIPMVGASGAVSGILGAYLVLYPTSRINTLVVFGLITTIAIPAYVFLGIWFFLQLFNSIGSIGPEIASSGGVAYFAHVGGFMVGILIGVLYRLGIGGNSIERSTRRSRYSLGGHENMTSFVGDLDVRYCLYCGSEDLIYPYKYDTDPYCNSCGSTLTGTTC